MTAIKSSGLRARVTQIIATAVLAGLTITSGVQAATLVGIYEGNDPFGGHDKGLYGTFGGVEISSPSLAKCDVSYLVCKWENGAVEGQDYTSAFNLSFTDDKSGSWSFAANQSLTHAPAYMVVKAAKNWALYALDGAAYGDWSTAALKTPNGKNQPGVSHVSFYNGATPVPLPAAAWLLLGGLGGLGAIARRRSRTA